MKNKNPLYEHLEAYRNGDKELPTYKELLEYADFFSSETIAYKIIIKNLLRLSLYKVDAFL